MADKIKVTLNRSVSGSTKSQIAIVRALGLGKRGRYKVLPNSDATRGAIRKISHLLTWEEI